MFTGIVQELGVVVSAVPVEFGTTLAVDPGAWAHRPADGDSIAVNGCCLTVARVEPSGDATLHFDVIKQTLDVTTLGGLQSGDRVNLEPPVTPSTLLGGHIVQGHIDGVGRVTTVRADATERRIRIALPPSVPRSWVVVKGSIAIDGVSMTVADVGPDWFEVALIPTTIERTTLGALVEGGRVNLEADYIVKAVVNWQEVKEQGGA